jgi:hypothetical protein
MTDEWGEWARPVPLLTAPMRVTWETCEISPRTTRSRAGRWDGVAVRYRSAAESSSWETDARIAAWARPKGTTSAWPFAALVYLSFCYTQHNRAGAHSGVPRWRWNWVIYNPELLEQTRPRVPSDFWAQSLSEAIAGLVAEIGRPSPGRIAAVGDPTRDRWAG